MRIVIDMQGAQTESRFRGIGRYTMSFAQALVRNRGEHDIFLALSGLFPNTIEPIRAAFDKLLSQEDIRVWYAPGPVKEELTINESRREVAELIREAFIASLSPDVIHITSLFEGYIDDAVTSIGRIDLSTPVSVSLYDLIPLLNPDHYLKPNPKYAKYYERKLKYLKKATLFLSISEFTRKDAKSNLGLLESNIVNISTAIEQRFRPLQIDNADATRLSQKFKIIKPFVLYTGGSDERKNLPRLIQAFAGLPSQIRSQHQLILSGRMGEEDIVKFDRLAKSIGIKTGELCFTGYVSDEELIQLYNLCKLFVFPSWHEGFGLPALEAMACGAPVITANNTSLPEVIGLDEAMFDPFDVSSITAKLSKALENDAFRDMLKNHGLQQAKRFSWDESAKRALAAWESLKKKQPQRISTSQQVDSKPKLAFVSPLPPERTGIADYSAELLPALADYYDIDVVVAQNRVDTAKIKCNCTVKDVSWLRTHADTYDRVLYQFGNSPFHTHMLTLIREISGAVVLHDFYMSGLMSWIELNTSEDHAWTESLYTAHGYKAVRERYQNAEDAKIKYPVNLHILQHAYGVIVHSESSHKLALKWYDPGCSDHWEVVPLLRSPIDPFDKAAVRKELGIHEDDFIVCSFGYLDSTKLNHRLLNAWLCSALARDKRCRLIFVGENHGGNYGANLLQMIKKSGHNNQISITGFAALNKFKQYLKAADLAVQLRADSRGETSAAVLDCMNYALPVIVNASGSMAELDAEAVCMLPERFDDSLLVKALESLRWDPERRGSLGETGRKIILGHHLPSECAYRYKEAIERFYKRAETSVPFLIKATADLKCFASNDGELLNLARTIAPNFPLLRPAKRFFLDVTATYCSDLRSGIERSTRALMLTLLESPPAGYRIEPVYLCNMGGNWHYRYARRYTLQFLDCGPETKTDERVEAENGDVLLGLDLSGDILFQAERAGLYEDYRNRGVTILFMVYDLLPIRIPGVFPPGADRAHERWLRAISKFDGAICISKTVADDLLAWQTEANIDYKNRRPFRIGWSHLGADLVNTSPSQGLPDNGDWTISQLRRRPSFLMVGTLEPRKGYIQSIETFDKLWAYGIDANLIIVGNEGWKNLPDGIRRDIPETVDRLRSHPELDKRLFWLEGISDEYLEKVYAACTCLIAASYGEGFGLPLIEAARHKLPIIARDIPVFREVAMEYAFYFRADNGLDFSKAVKKWLALYAEKSVPSSEGMPFLTWKQSAANLIKIIVSFNTCDAKPSFSKHFCETSTD